MRLRLEDARVRGGLRAVAVDLGIDLCVVVERVGSLVLRSDVR